jgi:hypothetical protein
MPPDSLDQDSAAIAEADTSLPPMPDVPRRRSGSLVLVAVGALDTTLTWPYKGGRCARPPMLFMLPSELGQSGASVLLELPAGDFAVDYPIRLADSAGIPEPPAAMVALQFFQEQTADAYQATDGVVTLSHLDETRASGTFQVTVRHIVTNRLARVAGAFHEVEVEALPPDYCATAQAAQDSLEKSLDPDR